MNVESTHPQAFADSSVGFVVDPDVWELRLYVAGQTVKSVAAFENLKRLCDAHLPGKYSIEVVDLLTHPQLARGDQIVAIPTWFVDCHTPFARLSAICRTWNGR